MADGDTADFNAFFCAAYPAARRVAYRILGSLAAAEDAAAEAFARALVSWRRVGGLAYREAWVMRVTSNVAIDAVRRRRRQAELEPVAAPANGVEDGAVLRATLVAALAALPRRQREVVVLRPRGVGGVGQAARPPRSGRAEERAFGGRRR